MTSVKTFKMTFKLNLQLFLKLCSLKDWIQNPFEAARTKEKAVRKKTASEDDPESCKIGDLQPLPHENNKQCPQENASCLSGKNCCQNDKHDLNDLLHKEVDLPSVMDAFGKERSKDKIGIEPRSSKSKNFLI